MLGGAAAGAAHAVVKGCSVLVSWGFVLTSGAGVSLTDAGAMGPAVPFCLGLVIVRRLSYRHRRPAQNSSGHRHQRPRSLTGGPQPHLRQHSTIADKQ